MRQVGTFEGRLRAPFVILEARVLPGVRSDPYAACMLTLIALVFALLFLSSPWNVVVVAAAIVIDVAEILIFVWWSRRRRRLGPPAVGVEALVGRRGIAVARLMPGTLEDIGQVRVDGEIWGARAQVPIEPGSSIVVRAVDGLVFEVEPAQPS